MQTWPRTGRPPGAHLGGGHEVRPLLLGLGWEQPGGLNRYVQDLHVALSSAGVSLRTIVVGPAGGSPETVIVAAQDDEPPYRRIWRYARVVRREGASATCLDAHFAQLAWWPVVVGRAGQLPLVVHFHGPWADESSATGDRRVLRAATKRVMERQIYRRASAVVVLSHAFGRLLVERYGVEPAKIRVIRPGVDLARFTPGRAAARRTLWLQASGGIVFSARRLVPRMGLDLLIDAWAQLPVDGERILLIAGEGPMHDALQSKIDRMGLHESVTLLGRVSEDTLVNLYRAADLSVMPSLALEGFGLSALESLACGTPVVVTDVGGLPEAVEALDPSLIVPAGQPTTLAARLHRGLGGDVPSGDACRTYAERFTWAAAVEHHMKVYAELATDRAPSVANRPQVVFLDHCAALSGGEIALLRLLEALDQVDAHVILGEDGPFRAQLEEAGHSVQVLNFGERTRGLAREDVALSRLSLWTAMDTIRYVATLTRTLKRLKPAIVHCNSLKSALYGGVAGRLAGIPVVWHARDRIAEDYLPHPAVRLVRAAARRLPSAVIANSQTTLSTLHLPPSARPAVVIPDPYERCGAVLSPHRSGARDFLVVGMVGRLAPWKGQDIFLRAFAKSSPAGRDRAVIVGSAMFGEDDYELELRRLVVELDIADRVDMVGFRHDIESQLANLDILVHASVVPEPFGQVIVEGMAAGLPVIATRAGGPAEIVHDDIDGLLVTPGDVDQLAAALTRLMDDQALRHRLGEGATQRAADYLPERIRPKVMDLYRGLLK